MRARRESRGEEGANAVEFALLLPVLITLLFGTMFGASLFNTQQVVSQAAREGARFGATLPLEAAGGTATAPGAWFTQVEERSRGVLETDRPLTRPGDTTVCVRFYYVDDSTSPATVTITDNGSGSCPTPSGASDLQGSRVEVTIHQPGRLELGIFPSPSATISGSGIARYEPVIE